MDKGMRQLIYTLSGIALLVLVIFFIIHYYLPKHDWNENYKPDNKEPYGAYVLSELLKNYYPGNDYQILKERWDSSSAITQFNRGGDNYIFIGKNCYLDSLSADALGEFVKRGNNALIIAPEIPYEILAKLGIHTCEEEDTVVPTSTDTVITDTSAKIITTDSILLDTIVKVTTTTNPPHAQSPWLATPSVNLNFTHPALQDLQGYIYHYVVDKDTLAYPWAYIVNDDSCTAFKFPFATLGTLGNEHINFIRAKYGDGNFLFHTTPIAFANYNLLDKRRQEYAEKVLSHLTKGNIYWDEYSRTVHMHFNKKMAGHERDETPLRYILSQPALRWAWYLMLALVLLYTLFQLKRKQRVIPVLETNTNTSIEFAQTISRLYFQQNDHRKLALQQMRLFLAYIRERYHINTSLDDVLLIASIAAKSGIPEMNISMIFGQHKYIEQMPDINETQLIEFNQLLEGFYQKCK